MPRQIAADQIAELLPRGATVLVQGGAGESALLADAVAATGRDDLHIVGVLLPSLNERSYGANRQTTFFLTPRLKAAGARIAFLPFPYTEILAYLGAARIDAALFMASTPDAGGNVSFGAAVDFLAELWPRIPVRIAHLNPLMPRTHGPTGIPYEALTAVVEQEAPLVTMTERGGDAESEAIAERVAALVPDGATLEAGIGKLPSACMRALRRKRDLRIHTGFIGEWALDLLSAGAIAKDQPIVTGLAAGAGPEFYDAMRSSAFAFRPVSYTHSAEIMRTLPGFVAINGALEVDLLGQVYAECGPDGFVSGPGGATDFARGAKLAGGLRVIALPAAAKGAGRIVAPGGGRGPVSLSRFDVDVVVTQHGAADLRGLSHGARAAALIAVAGPDHRDALEAAWAEFETRAMQAGRHSQ